jgi:hypothetical protein
MLFSLLLTHNEHRFGVCSESFKSFVLISDQLPIEENRGR